MIFEVVVVLVCALTSTCLQVLVQREKVLVEGIRASLEAMWEDCPAIVQLQNASKLQQGFPGGTKRGILQAFASPTASSQMGEEDKGNHPEKRQRTLANFLTSKPCVQGQHLGNEKDEVEHPSLKSVSSNVEEEEDLKENEFSDEKENLQSEARGLEKESLGLKITFETPVSMGRSGDSALELFDTPPKSQELSPNLSKGVKASEKNEVVAGTNGLKISFHPVTLKNNTTEHVIQPTSEDSPTEILEKKTENNHSPLYEVSGVEETTLTMESRGFQTAGRSEAVDFSVDFLRESLKRCSREEEDKKIKNPKFRAKIEPGENGNAEEELNKQIKKTDFAKMEIFGQFNLGFLIVGLGKDLFIVDQHATDEKYNFETLQRTTHIRPQKMVVAQGLELTAGDEATLIDHLEVFEKNGFQFKVDKEAAAGRRVKLVAVPTSKNWVFGKEDIDELIFMLSDAGGELEGVTIRPSRVW